MSAKGYSAITDAGFVAFPRDLDASPAWKDIAPPLDPATPPDLSVLWGSSLNRVCKWFILYAIHQLQGAILRAPSAASLADNRFDREQRLLDLELTKESLSDDPARAAAADLLRDALLLGGGSGQTHLPFQEEVDFGRSQVVLARQPNLSSALALLGLRDRLTHIATATENLAVVIGRSDQDPTLAPSQRLRLVRVQCVAIFNTVHGLLSHLQVAASSPADLTLANALLVPFNALLSRHTKPSPT